MGRAGSKGERRFRVWKSVEFPRESSGSIADIFPWGSLQDWFLTCSSSLFCICPFIIVLRMRPTPKSYFWELVQYWRGVVHPLSQTPKHPGGAGLYFAQDPILTNLELTPRTFAKASVSHESAHGRVLNLRLCGHENTHHRKTLPGQCNESVHYFICLCMCKHARTYTCLHVWVEVRGQCYQFARPADQQAPGIFPSLPP